MTQYEWGYSFILLVALLILVNLIYMFSKILNDVKLIFTKYYLILAHFFKNKNKKVGIDTEGVKFD